MRSRFLCIVLVAALLGGLTAASPVYAGSGGDATIANSSGDATIAKQKKKKKKKCKKAKRAEAAKKKKCRKRKRTRPQPAPPTTQPVPRFASLVFGGQGASFLVALGHTRDHELVLRNRGTTGSGTPVFSITGGGSDWFSIVSTTCTGPVPAYSSCTVTVRYTAYGPEGASATLSATANPGGTASTTLKGTTL